MVTDMTKEEFYRQVELLKEIDLITEADIVQLATYCDAYADYVECSRSIQEEGLMVEHANKAETNKIDMIPL
jgi:P27 family predicted phage terminase small subunit